MCTCGCAQYLSQDKQSMLQRAIEIARALNLREENATLYEDGECICGMLGPEIPLTQEGEDIWQVVKTVNSFHEDFHAERRRSALNAARDVFNRFPVKGDAKHLLTLWQQLERLHREIPDQMIDNLDDKSLAAAIKAMRNIHDNGSQRKSKLIEHYNLARD